MQLFFDQTIQFDFKQFNLTSNVQVNGQIWGSYSSVHQEELFFLKKGRGKKLYSGFALE